MKNYDKVLILKFLSQKRKLSIIVEEFNAEYLIHHSLRRTTCFKAVFLKEEICQKNYARRIRFLIS